MRPLGLWGQRVGGGLLTSGLPRHDTSCSRLRRGDGYGPKVGDRGVLLGCGDMDRILLARPPNSVGGGESRGRRLEKMRDLNIGGFFGFSALVPRGIWSNGLIPPTVTYCIAFLMNV